MLRKTLTVLLFALPVLASSAAAQHNNLEAGSLLVYPEFDNRPGSLTFITVTNTNQSQACRAHMIYVAEDDCLQSNANEFLTPRDTVTAFTQAHAPGVERGFLFAYAQNTSAQAITFNHLIGQVLVVDGVTPRTYSMNPVVFKGMTGEGNPTDLDFDGTRDLNGLEYGRVPDKIAIPRFFGQFDHPTSPPFVSHLVFVNLTGRQFTTIVNFQIFNDNEEAFSAQHSFGCWDSVPLLSISGAFGNHWLKTATDHDPTEVIGMADAWESGWMLIDGSIASSSSSSVSDPAFLAALIETDRIRSASLPFGVGTQTNGDLFPASTNPDNN